MGSPLFGYLEGSEREISVMTRERHAGGVVKAKEQPKQHVIKFYANEIFTVDDGPPRNIHDQVNQAFISHIMKGECPPELGADTHTDVQLMNLHEDYSEPDRPRCVS